MGAVERYVAVYARASSDPGEKKISVDRQRERCLALAEQVFPGVETRLFSDNNLSGAKDDVVRPEYDQLLGALRRGEVAGLVVHEQSRLTRQPHRWEELLLILALAGIETVHTVQQGPIGVAAQNALLSRILAAVDAEEVARIRARQRAMHEQLAAEGRPTGVPPYGYTRSVGPDGRPCWLIDPDQAVIARRLVDQVLAGRSLNSLAQELNREGVPTARISKGWRTKTIRQLVTMPAIAGLRQHRGRVVGPGQWEPIITPERWEAVMAALNVTEVTDEQGRPYTVSRDARGSKGRKWLLTNTVVRCGHCGGPLRAVVAISRGRTKRMNYSCGPREVHPDACMSVAIGPAELLEEIVTEMVLQQLDRPDLMKMLTGSHDEERQRLSEALHLANNRLELANTLLGDGSIERAEWETIRRPARAAVDAAKGALAALPGGDEDVLVHEALGKQWEELSLNAKRALLERVFPNGIVIRKAKGSGRPVDAKARMMTRIDWQWDLNSH